MKYLKYFVISVLVMLTAVSCTKNPHPGFKKTDNGLYYKYHIQSESTEKPQEGDLLFVEMIYRTSADSILFDSRVRQTPAILNLEPSYFKGDILEGFAMMSAGDSVTFVQPVDSFFQYFARIPVPEGLKKGDFMFFDIKMVKFMSEEAYFVERQKEAEEKKISVDAEIDAYLKANNLNAKLQESGLYYVETLKGKGATAAPGKKVSVHYTGKFLDGNVFDSSHNRQQPIEFTLGRGEVIRGWDEGISLMSKGGKATLVIPFFLAYGEDGRPPVIAPYATLVFDVELVDIK